MFVSRVWYSVGDAFSTLHCTQHTLYRHSGLSCFRERRVGVSQQQCLSLSSPHLHRVLFPLWMVCPQPHPSLPVFPLRTADSGSQQVKKVEEQFFNWNNLGLQCAVKVCFC